LLLPTSVQTVLLLLGAVLVIVGVVGTTISAGTIHVGAPGRRRSRAVMVIVGLAVFVLAVVNPVVHRFSVFRDRVDVTPRYYRGPCPVGVELVGIVRAKNGSGKVTSSLYLASVLGAGTREIRMENGDSVQRTVVVQKSVTTRAFFEVLSPNKVQANYPVKVICTKTR
jgi:hypothetical protein